MSNSLQDATTEELIDLLAEAIETSNAPNYNVKGILRELLDRAAKAQK